MKTAIVVDTEVNSMDSKECIDLAWVAIPADVSRWDRPKYRTFSSYFKPTNPIEAAAIAVHGILPQHVEDCLPSVEAKIPESEFVIGHNVDFDCEVLNITTPKRICTLALSQYLWPEFKSHKLSVMIIELMGATQKTLDEIGDAHGAATDVRLTLVLLNKILQKTGIDSFDDLYELSEKGRIPTVMKVGMHRGLRIETLPKSYIRWLLNQADVDYYLRIALEQAANAG